MRRYLSVWAVGGLLATVVLCGGCGSSGSSGSGSSSSGVAITGTVSTPTDASASESAPLSKSLSKSVGLKDVASLSKDTAVGEGKEVTITDAKSGAVLATGKTDPLGGYSLSIPSTTTDCIITVKIDDTTELNRIYAATGSAASGVSVDADTTSASVAVLQECQKVAGISTDIDVSDLASKCGAAITAGTLIPSAVYEPYLKIIDSGVEAGSADGSTGKGACGAQGLMYRELLSNKLKGKFVGDPWDITRKAYLVADSASLAHISTYAPTISATVSPTVAFSLAKDLGKAMAVVTNDKTTSEKCKGDWSAVSKLYENFDATAITKVTANPDDLQFQLKDSFDNKQTDKLKDKKYTTLFTDACGDKNFSNLKTDEEKKAYTKLIYATDLSSKTAIEAKTIGTGLINTIAAACPSGTCDATKLASVQNNPTTYTSNVLADPTKYGGSSGDTFCAGLINQVGTTEVITGTPPTFTACTTATDCGTAATGTTFVCINNFCQNSSTAKASGAACSYNGDCLSGSCSEKVCIEPKVATTGTAGTFTSLQANGGSCLASYQCTSAFCDASTHTCKALADAPKIGDSSLSGAYKPGTSPSNILSAKITVTPNSGTPPTADISLSEGLYGHFTATVNDSGQLTFSGTVHEGAVDKTLTCTNVPVTNSGSTLSGTDVCTLGGTSKSINHTK